MHESDVTEEISQRILGKLTELYDRKLPSFMICPQTAALDDFPTQRHETDNRVFEPQFEKNRRSREAAASATRLPWQRFRVVVKNSLVM